MAKPTSVENSSTGENYVWLMNGATITGEGSVRTEPDQNWQVAGVGDFNGDGKADIRGETLYWRKLCLPDERHDDHAVDPATPADCSSGRPRRLAG